MASKYPSPLSLNTVGQAPGPGTECRCESYDLYMVGAVGNGYIRDDTPTTDFQRYDFDKKSCSQLKNNLWAPRRTGFAVATLGDQIWVLGGIATDGNREYASNIVSVYNTKSGEWGWMDDMYYKRADLCAVFVGDILYAIGGRFSGRGKSDLQSHRRVVEKFERNRWENCTPMKIPRSSFASCVVENKIYVAGGAAPQSPTGRVEYYSTDTNEWTYATDMPNKRESFGLVFVNRKLYAVGGDRDGSVIRRDENLLDEVVVEEWSDTILSLPTEFRSYDVFSLGGEIFVVGKTEKNAGGFYKFRPTDLRPKWKKISLPEISLPSSPWDGGFRVALIKNRPCDNDENARIVRSES